MYESVNGKVSTRNEPSGGSARDERKLFNLRQIRQTSEEAPIKGLVENEISLGRTSLPDSTKIIYQL